MLPFVGIASRSCSQASLCLGFSLFVIAALVAGCKTGPSLSAEYAQTALENYELANGEFADKDWEETIQYADFVRIRFPFSRYAVEAELLVARAEFEQANYIAAQDSFRRFAKLHPTHEHSRNGWASFMAAAAAYMNAPTQNFFLLPQNAQLDQTPLKEALEALDEYYERYRGSVTSPFADLLRADVLRRLLDHELYVARYYLDRDKPEAAIGRLTAAHGRFSGVGRDADVLFLLGLTYLRMEEVELARTTFSELNAQHPEHHHGKQARVYLAYIRNTYGPADPARPRPDRPLPVPERPARPKNPEAPAHPERATSQPTSPAAQGAS